MTNVSKNTSNLIAAMEANYTAYATYFSRVPYLELLQSPDITLIMSKEFALWNVVINTHLVPENVTASIEATLSTFDSLNLPLVWHILPSTQPSDLEQHLEEHDFLLFEEEPHMLIEPARHALHMPDIAGFTIECVTDVASFARWHKATVAGFFPNTPSLGQIYFDAYTLLGFDLQGPFLHYVGYMHGEPVTSSTLLLTEGMAGIYDVSTIPSARGKGFGTAITLAPLLEAQARGYRYVCLQATQMGYPIYQRIGFTEQYRAHKYLWRPTNSN
ncbi:MAG: hypothetical protein NVS4B11_11280 [Ktedonobacteraceae bacterium]